MIITAKAKLPYIQEFTFNELTNSARTTFTQCRKKFYWAYICRLTPISTPKALLIGHLFHYALEQFYKNFTYNKDEINLYIDTEVEKAANECLDATQADELWKQASLIKALVEGYMTYYEKRDKATWKVIAPETKFAFKLKNGWINRGMRDLLIKKGKDIYLVEHKTTTILDANYLAKLPLDSQIMSYAISCKKDLKTFPKGIIYNVSRKAGIRWKQSETLEQFYERLRQEYLSMPANYFYREIITFSPTDLNAYEVDLNDFSFEIERAIKEHYFYMNYANCTNYGICPYMQLCTARTEKALKEALLSYRVKEDAHEELSK